MSAHPREDTDNWWKKWSHQNSTWQTNTSTGVSYRSTDEGWRRGLKGSYLIKMLKSPHPPPPVKTQETCMLRLSAWLAGSSPSWRNSSALQLLLLIWPWGETLGIFWAKYSITHCSCSKHRTREPSAVNGIPFPANPGNFWLIPNFAKPL